MPEPTPTDNPADALPDTQKPARAFLRAAATRMRGLYRSRYASSKLRIGHQPEGYKIPERRILKEQLAATPRFLHNPDGIARIWSYIGDSNPQRGDSHGAIGLANAVATQLQGHAVHVDDAMLARHFPDMNKLQDRIRALRARDGFPDIVIGLGHCAHDDNDRYYEDIFEDSDCPTLRVSHLNEHIPGGYRSGLVPHHLDADTLHEEGRIFRAHYPDLPGPLIAVFVGNVEEQLNSTREKIARKIVNAASHHGSCTLFLCHSWRMPQFELIATIGTLHGAIEGKGALSRIKLVTMDPQALKDGYNPYRGLIDQADHAILWGSSQSMLAEIISQGRSLYATRPLLRHLPLRHTGYVKSFNRHAADTPLTSTMRAPVNATTAIARTIADEFDRMARLRTLAARTQVTAALPARHI